MTYITSAFPNGLTYRIGSDDALCCESCGAFVKAEKWASHVAIHTAMFGAGYTYTPEDILARLTKLESYMFDEKQKAMDELMAIKSIVEMARKNVSV